MENRPSHVRTFRTAFDEKFLNGLQKGVMSYTYRGVSCLKCPLDMALYAKLLWELRPGTLFELGTYKGGSALWFADQIAAIALRTRFISIDVKRYREIEDPRIEFILADVHKLAMGLTPDILARCPRPWLIIEDSKHSYSSTMASLNFFDPLLQIGDVVIVEDGVLDDLGMSKAHDGGPNRALQEFLPFNHAKYEVMLDYCDFYGPNATYNPNGYLRRVA